MNRLAAVAALAVAMLAAPTSANAQVTQVTLPGTYLFATVDEVGQQGSSVVITGVLQGEAAPVTLTAATINSSSAVDLVATQCQRYALLAQAKPGQYLLQVTIGNSVQYYVSGCRLRRAVP